MSDRVPKTCHTAVSWEEWAFSGGRATAEVTWAFTTHLSKVIPGYSCDGVVIRQIFIALAMAERTAIQVDGDDYSTLYWDWVGEYTMDAGFGRPHMTHKSARRVMFSVLTAITVGGRSPSEEHLRMMTLAAARTIVDWYRENG